MLLALSSALAAPAVSVWATTPLAETAVVTYALPDGTAATQTTYSPQSPTFRFDVGLGGTATFPAVGGGAVAVDGALTLFSAEWERTPLDYRAATWTVRLGAGWRQWLPGDHLLRAYGEAGMLLSWEMFLPQWTSGYYQLGPGTYTRLGVELGRGAARPSLALKLGASLGGGRTTITANGADGFRAEWHSSHAFALVELGVDFHPVAPDAPPPETP